MTAPTSSDNVPPRSSWARKLAITVGVLLALLVVAYFVVSSSAFFKAMILPRIAKALNAQITVSDASISPFSQVVLDKVKVQTIGAEPLLTAEQVRARYRLFAILRGNYGVDELTLTTPVIQIVTEPGGTSNLDPITKSNKTAPSTGAKSSEPLRVSIRNVSLKDGTVRQVERTTAGEVKTMELTQLNLNVDQIANGGTGKLTLGTNLKIENRPAPGQAGTNDVLESKVAGDFAFQLDSQLLPKTLTGSANLGLGRVAGAYAEFAGLAGTFQTDVTPTEIRQLVLRFERGGQSLGRIQASGPLDLAKREGRLTLVVQSIDRQILNLVGASRGWDFGRSTINSTNVLDLSRNGDVIGAKGQLNAREVTVSQEGQTTPALNLDVDYEVTVNRSQQSAVLRNLTVGGQQQQRNLLRASLDRPMTLTWGPGARGADSTFQLAVTQLNLKEWRSLIGTNLSSGLLDLQLTVSAKQDGQDLATKGTILIQDLAAAFGTNRIDRVRLSLGIDGRLQSFKTVNVEQYSLEAQRLNQLLLRSTGSGHYDRTVKDLTLQATTELALPGLLQQFPTPNVEASSGAVRLSAAVAQKNDKYALTGNLSLTDFTGKYGAYRFQDLQSATDYNVDLDSHLVQVHNVALTFRRGYSAGGSVALQGDYDLDKRSTHLTFRLADLNQNILEPILAPSLNQKKLVSLSLNGTGTASYDPAGDASIRTELALTNWVVASPGQRTPPKLAGQVQLDAGMRQQIVDLRQLVLTLSPTARAKNQISAKARLDLNHTNATPSQLTVEADSLDVTPYYDMFAGNSSSNAPALPPPGTASPTIPAPGPPANPAEPAPVQLPFEQLSADVKIGRFYMRELAVTNFQTSARISRGEVTLKPVAMTLNGGPVAADAVLNLGVPGYTYNLSFNCDRVPLAPLSNTFTTNTPGQLNGILLAKVGIKGAGLTGPNLKKNLSGSLALNLTNMSYEIVGRKVKRLLEPIALVLRVPELTQTPLNWIGANVGIGSGRIELQDFTVRSQAFYAESKGTIPMADVLTNSPLKLPVSLSLSRNLAEKANLLAADTPTNATYAPLPAFVTLAGTVGDPKTEINKLIIGGLLAKSIGGIVPVGDKAGAILQGVGGILSGQGPGPAKTNAPAGTNASPAANLVRDISSALHQPKKGSATTNAPASSTNKPAKASPLDLLKLIPEKK